MHLIKRTNLEACLEGRADARQAVANWVAQVRAARWTCMDDIVRSLPGARAIPNDRVVFRIKGNTYRIICAVRFPSRPGGEGALMLKFFGTHAEYDEIDATTVEQWPGGRS